MTDDPLFLPSTAAKASAVFEFCQVLFFLFYLANQLLHYWPVCCLFTTSLSTSINPSSSSSFCPPATPSLCFFSPLPAGLSFFFFFFSVNLIFGRMFKICFYSLHSCWTLSFKAELWVNLENQCCFLIRTYKKLNNCYSVQCGAQPGRLFNMLLILRWARPSSIPAAIIISQSSNEKKVER